MLFFLIGSFLFSQYPFVYEQTTHISFGKSLAFSWCFVFDKPICHKVFGRKTTSFDKVKLSNGLTYYIYNDGSIPGEAQYYLYQNVGAVLEESNETGLAHFLEHLAFNATKSFPKGIMSFLRENNLHDFEAYTGLDETKYAVHNVPTNDPKLNEKDVVNAKRLVPWH